MLFPFFIAKNNYHSIVSSGSILIINQVTGKTLPISR